MPCNLQVENLTKSFGTLLLFENISFGLDEGDKVGLIAPNGSGKSTLMSILSGREGYDSGRITFRKDLRVAFLEQDPLFPEGATVMEACCAQARQNGASSWLDDGEHDQKARELLSKLGVGEFDREAATLSGGQQKRIALASALLAGAAVSFAGLLGFVGLLVPHMGRRLVGTDNRWLLAASALLGGAFVLLCDVLARVLFAPFEVPVGIVMSLLGGPFFLSLLLRNKRGRVYD